MKGQSIKDLLKDYKREIDFIDFDDELELINLFSARGSLIERYEELTETQLRLFNKLEVEFINNVVSNLMKFQDKIIYQNSLLYTKLRQAA